MDKELIEKACRNPEGKKACTIIKELFSKRDYKYPVSKLYPICKNISPSKLVKDLWGISMNKVNISRKNIDLTLL